VRGKLRREFDGAGRPWGAGIWKGQRSIFLRSFTWRNKLTNATVRTESQDGLGLPKGVSFIEEKKKDELRKK